MVSQERPRELWLVEAPEIWPCAPEARRRAWTNGLFAAVFQISGQTIVRTIERGQAVEADRGSADCIALHLHGDMPMYPERFLSGFDRGDRCPLVMFGELTSDHEQLRLLDEFAPEQIFRGIPAPLWATEVGRLMSIGVNDTKSRLLPPLIPGWPTLPGSCYHDPANDAVLLVRASLGLSGSEAGCGLTSFEGPYRSCGAESLIDDLQCLARTGGAEAEVVDPELQLQKKAAFDWWLDVLKRCGSVKAWTLPMAELGADAGDQMERLRAAGLIKVRTRLLSASADVCSTLHGRSNPDGVQGVLRQAHRLGVETELLLEIGAPGEREEDRARTAAWLELNAPAIDHLVMRAFAPEPGSEMTTDPRRYGIWWVPGGARNEWVDRRGSNLTMRHKVLSELVVFAQDLGIECEAPRVNLAVDVVRRRDAVAKRYRNVAARSRGTDSPSFPAGKTEDDVRPAELKPDTVDGEKTARNAEGGCRNGPITVEIELSAACNLRCIGCWCHSELVKNERHQELQAARPLPTERLIELLDELAEIGVREIQFSGSGEPLMNRDTAAIIEHATSLGLKTILVTNGVLLDESLVRRLTGAGLAQMTVSLWAGDLQTYDRTHPSVAPGTFDRLTGSLKIVAAARDPHGRPLLKTYHVISRLNCRFISEMVEHALTIDADEIELQLIDVMQETEAELALSVEHVVVIEEALATLRKRPDYVRLWIGVLPVKDGAPDIVRQELTDFGRFLRLGDRVDLFTVLDGRQVRCRRGFTAEGYEGAPDGFVAFDFPESVCHECELRSSCFPNGRLSHLVLPTMKMTGVGSFVRRARASVVDSGSSEAGIVRDLPCVVGDVYSRVDYRGNVVACCKGSSAPLGNVSDTAFAEVWQSPRYAEFRRNAKTLPKDDPFFAPFGCLRSCDNLGMNLRALYVENPGGPDEGDRS